MSFAAEIKKVDAALPGKTISVLLFTIGLVYIILALSNVSNLVKLTLFTYAIVP